MRPGDGRVVSNSIVLDWTPTIHLEEGLRRTIPYLHKLDQDQDAEARVLTERQQPQAVPI